MANILEFLRGVLTEPDAQEAFRKDPEAYVDDAGFVDLTGEDVVEAVLVLRRSLPDELANRLGAFEDDDDLPSVRPGPEETELDAAVRMLAFAIAEVGDVATVPAAAGAAGPSEAIDVENELDTDLATETPPAPAAAAPEPAATAAPAAATPAPAAAAAPTTPLTGGAGEVEERFSDALDRVVAEANAAIEQAAGDARARLRDVVASAHADAEALRAEGEHDREAARNDADRIRADADALLQRAREQSEESRRRADELVAAAQAEAEATHAEVTARRAELREVERKLKERLAEIDSLFRTALRDEEETGTA